MDRAEQIAAAGRSVSGPRSTGDPTPCQGRRSVVSLVVGIRWAARDPGIAVAVGADGRPRCSPAAGDRLSPRRSKVNRIPSPVTAHAPVEFGAHTTPAAALPCASSRAVRDAHNTHDVETTGTSFYCVLLGHGAVGPTTSPVPRGPAGDRARCVCRQALAFRANPGPRVRLGRARDRRRCLSVGVPGAGLAAPGWSTGVTPRGHRGQGWPRAPSLRPTPLCLR